MSCTTIYVAALQSGNIILASFVQCCVIAGLLTCMSIQDIRTKQIPVWILLVLAGCSIFITCMDQWRATSSLQNAGQMIFLRIVLGILPGCAMLFAGKLTGGAIGSGDSYTVLALGIHMGIFSVLTCLMYGMCLSGICSMVLLLRGKYKKKDTIPFLPFLSAGYMIVAISNLWNG